MKIEVSNGYVILKDVVTRKAAREYKEKLFKDVEVENTGGFDKDGNPITRYKMPPQNSELAAEALVLALTEKVVVIEGSEEKVVAADRCWLDNLPETDFNKIDAAARSIKQGSDDNSKKS